MEIISQPRIKPAYYFSLLDHEILDDRLLSLSSDDDTWLYKSEIASFDNQYKNYQMVSPFQSSNIPSASGSVDSRTYTRRKHPMQTPPQSVVESSFSNRSSLGLLSQSKLLNDTTLVHFQPSPISENLGKTFSNSIGSNPHGLPQRNFKLDSPFINTTRLGKLTNFTFERNRVDSESSDISTPQSLENLGSFGKNDAMTDSLVNFLEKQEVKCRPPTAFQDECQMTDSLLSLPENCEQPDAINERMTDSMVNFLLPVHCKPPSEFEDSEINESIVEIDGTNILPNCDLTKSAVNYLEDVKCNQNGPLIESTSSETENIPPHDIVGEDSAHPCTKATGEVLSENGINATFEIEKNEDITFNISNKSDEIDNITFTNSVNITRKRHDRGDHEDSLPNAKTLNGCLDKGLVASKYNIEKNVKSKALNNRDLNVTTELKNNEILDTNSGKIGQNDLITQQLKCITTTNKNGFIKDNDLNGTFTKLPSRNSTFNTTFTKLESPDRSTNCNYGFISSKNQTKSLIGLNSTFVAKSSEMLCGGLDDDQTSSASDSSFSSSSTKPRSVDELRTIARQQETNLVQQTSTPTDCSVASSNLTQLNLELSPIRRQSLEGCKRLLESRSANHSPVRSPHPRMPGPHPISRFHQTTEIRRQNLQASSLSNIAMPKVSGLRAPQPVSRLPPPRQSIARPSTAPTPKVTGIPRPQMSRLPKPTQFRSTGIPGLKRGGGYH